MSQTNDFVIDIHIPFVSEKLKLSTAHQIIGDHAARMEYLAALEAEARAVAPDIDGEIKAIRISGPAPSIMSPDGISRLLRVIHDEYKIAPHCEIDIAALPQTVGTPSLTGWGSGEINRVSLRADSLQPTELIALDRPFDSVQIQNALLFLDKFRYQNVNVTLSIGIPGQTEVTLMQNVRSLNEIDTPHITLQPIRVASEGVLDQDQQKALFESATERLESYGYRHYAPGYFAKEDRWRSRFALALAGGAYLIGLGIGAQTLCEDVAYTNTQDFHSYVQGQGDAEKTVAEIVTVNDELLQTTYVLNRLKYANSFSQKELEQRYDTLCPAVNNQLQTLETEGLLSCKDGEYCLTKAGQFRWLFV